MLVDLFDGEGKKEEKNPFRQLVFVLGKFSFTRGNYNCIGKYCTDITNVENWITRIYL